MRKIGNTAVTELGFGAAAIGNLFSPVSQETAAAAVDMAWEAAG